MPNNKIVLFTALFAGLTFGLGLMLSGMTNPSKVLAFLDVTGAWDPSLAFVMVGAIAIAAVAFASVKKRNQSLLAQKMQFPNTRDIDMTLILGSLSFGVGWGLAGICPGPALVLLGMLSLKGIVFVIFMGFGMWLFEVLSNSQK
jgi:uncharacterized protein